MIQIDYYLVEFAAAAIYNNVVAVRNEKAWVMASIE